MEEELAKLKEEIEENANATALHGIAGTQIFAPEQVIIHQGEVGQHMYVILKGTVELVVDGVVVGTKSENEFFGERAALGVNFFRNATVRASPRSDEVILLSFSKNVLRMSY